jgi:hypothetical protein
MLLSFPTCTHDEARGHAPLCFKCQQEYDQKCYEAEAPARKEKARFIANKLQQLIDDGFSMENALLELLNQGWLS